MRFQLWHNLGLGYICHLGNGTRHVLTLIVALWSLPCLAKTIIETPSVVDIGQVQIGTAKDFELIIKNVSSQEAQIVEVQPSCSCTQVKLSGSKTLAPGAELVVTGKVQYPLKIGDYRTTVRVEYKVGDALQGVTESAIRGAVISALAMDRTPVDFGEMEESGSPQMASIKIQRGNSGQDWDAIKLTVPSEHVQAKIDNVEDGTKRLTITLIPKGLSIGVYRGNIDLKLFKGGKEINESASVSLTARILGPLKASPHTVSLGAVPPNASITRVIDLKSDASNLGGLIVKTPQGIIARILDVAKGEKRLEVSVKSPAANGYFVEAVVIEDPDTKAVLRIPILGFVNAQP